MISREFYWLNKLFQYGILKFIKKKKKEKEKQTDIVISFQFKDK